MPHPDELLTIDVAVENQGGVLRLDGPWVGESPVMRLEHWTIDGEVEWATSDDEEDGVRLIGIRRWDDSHAVELTHGEVPVDLLCRFEDWLYQVAEEAKAKRESAREAA